MLNQPVIVGSPVISTAQSKFGGSSLFLPASNSGINYLNYDNKGIIFYPEFTLEFFIKFVYAYSYGCYNLGDLDSIFFYNHQHGVSKSRLFLSIRENSASYIIPSFIVFEDLQTMSNFKHIAVTRSLGGYYRVFVDGVLVKEVLSSKLVNPNGLFKIGSYSEPNTNLTYYDELRIKNECVYTQNFEVPSSPFQTDLKTLLLLHFDGVSGSQIIVDSSDIGVCDIPAASVPSGIYSGPFHVVLSCITPDSLIYYRINSGEWIQDSLVNIQNSCTVQVKSVKNGLQDSEILTLNYIVKCSSPVFNLDSGFYASLIQVILSNNVHDIYEFNIITQQNIHD